MSGATAAVKLAGRYGLAWCVARTGAPPRSRERRARIRGRPRPPRTLKPASRLARAASDVVARACSRER